MTNFTSVSSLSSVEQVCNFYLILQFSPKLIMIMITFMIVAVNTIDDTVSTKLVTIYFRLVLMAKCKD